MYRKLFLNAFFGLFLSLFADTLLADEAPPIPPTPGTETVEQKLAAALKREEDYKAEIEKFKKKEPAGGDPDDGDLVSKARKDKENKDKENADHKNVERALKFNLTVDDFVKTNKGFLPDEIDGILSRASKERYDSEFEKASALKSAIIKSFFDIQANLDTLTSSQKNQVENWKSLTKGEREKRAADLYENVFEPCIETSRRVKKAEEVTRSRQGLASHSDSGMAYKEKLIQIAQAAHLGIRKA